MISRSYKFYKETRDMLLEVVREIGPPRSMLIESLGDLYGELSPTERCILWASIGYDLEGPLTTREIGEVLKLEYLEVSQRYETMMVRLRNKLRPPSL